MVMATEGLSESDKLVISRETATEHVEAHASVRHLNKRVSQQGLPSCPDHIHVRQLRKAPHFLGSSLVFVPLSVVPLVMTPIIPKAQHMRPTYMEMNFSHGGMSSESVSGEAAMLPSLGDCSAELLHPLISLNTHMCAVPVIDTASFVGHRVL